MGNFYNTGSIGSCLGPGERWKAHIRRKQRRGLMGLVVAIAGIWYLLEGIK